MNLFAGFAASVRILPYFAALFTQLPWLVTRVPGGLTFPAD
jgi:hypothetical protein